MNIKYVFFDCWSTIIEYIEKEENGDMKLLYPYINEKDTITVEQLVKMLKDIYKVYYAQNQWDISAQSLLALLIESNGLSLSISYKEAEDIICKNFGPTPVPYIDTFLEYLEKKGIKCSVLSNTTLSNENTAKFINNVIPNNHFEFIVASSRVGAKKPNPLFFKVGLAKVGVKPEEVIYIGDNFIADCYGSYLAGMKPLWFNRDKKSPHPDYHPQDYIEFDSYLDLIDMIENNKL